MWVRPFQNSEKERIITRKPLAAVAADLHLQERAWADRRQLCGDAYHAFQQIGDYARRHGLPVVAAGDLIDKKKNDSGLVRFVRRELDKLQRDGVPFLYVQGDHDYQEAPWFSAIHPWPKCLDNGSEEFSLGGYRLCGFDWRPATQLKELLEGGIPDDTDILVMHQSCEELVGGVFAAEMSAAEVPHASVLVVGDIHKHVHKECAGRNGQALDVLSPGSACMQSIDEPVDKRFFVLYDDLSVRSVPIRSRRYLQPPPLLVEEDIDDFAMVAAAKIEKARQEAVDDKLPEHLQKPVLWVRYHVDLGDAVQRVRNVVKDTAHIFPKPLRSTEDAAVEEGEDEYANEGEQDHRIGREGLLGCLPEIVDPDEHPRRYDQAKRLLLCEDPDKELSQMAHERGLFR